MDLLAGGTILVQPLSLAMSIALDEGGQGPVRTVHDLCTLHHLYYLLNSPEGSFGHIYNQT